MTRARKTPAEVRREAAQAIRDEANCAENTGDPEGAGRLRDLARYVERIRLTRATLTKEPTVERTAK